MYAQVYFYYICTIKQSTKMEKVIRYRQIQDELKREIQQGHYIVGDLLPSENELCATYHITRTTARKALEELQREGFITRQHGKGSIVCERRNTIGLLTVKGFTETVGEHATNIFVAKPAETEWPQDFAFAPSDKELQGRCTMFSRLRCISQEPVVLEESWLASAAVPAFAEEEFVQGSFFSTLSKRYLIEITGSEHEIRAMLADQRTSILLNVPLHSPILYISVRYSTSVPGYYVYSKLYCNTAKYPIGNIYRTT